MADNGRQFTHTGKAHLTLICPHVMMKGFFLSGVTWTHVGIKLYHFAGTVITVSGFSEIVIKWVFIVVPLYDLYTCVKCHFSRTELQMEIEPCTPTELKIEDM